MKLINKAYLYKVDQGFLVDRSILFDVRVSNQDFRVYSFFLSAMDKETKICSSKQENISKSIGMSRTAIYRCIKHLKKIKLIDVERKSNTNNYHILSSNN
tara:strand:+ start:57 stop:356 length:300 start_codon:yes stop_codon:yes gene_type:complete